MRPIRTAPKIGGMNPFLVSLAAAAAAAQGLPPIPADLVGTAAIVCVRVVDRDNIEAFILTSTGDPGRDKAVIAWVRQLRWDPESADGMRGWWFPMPVAFDAVPPMPPESCAPPADRPGGGDTKRDRR